MRARRAGKSTLIEALSDEGDRVESEDEECEGLLEEAVKLGGDVEKMRPQEDARAVRKLIDPRLPTKEEVKDHELKGHVPYRDWCPICAKAKGKDLDHRADPLKERNLPEYSFDFAFPGDELGHKTAVLVGKERLSGLTLAAAIPVKGSEGRFMLEKALGFMAEAGDMEGRIVVKSDQEPAVKRLVKDLAEERTEGRTVIEESPVGSSGSNGVVERTVQKVEGQIRAVLLALEAKLGQEVAADEPIITYIPEHASYLMNRLEVGRDGKTAYERIRGKRASVLGLEFGEKVLFMKKEKGKTLAKLRSKWDYGIFVGVRVRSNEIWVATREKTLKVRSVRRLPEEARWSADTVKWVRHTMWNKFVGDEEADGDIPEGKGVEAQGVVEPKEGVTIVTKDRAPRDFYITKANAEQYGYTKGCPGCSSWFRGGGRQPHTAACRERFRKEMVEEAKVKLADSRKEQFVEEQLHKKQRKEEKQERREARKQEKRRLLAEAEELESKRSRSSGDGGVKRKAEGDVEDEDQMVDIDEDEAKRWITLVSAEGGQHVEVDAEVEADGELDPLQVKEARREEVQFMKERNLWDVVPVPEGVVPVSVRWVDVRKGDGSTRSRLVARDFRGGDRRRDDLFAATPPLEAIRAVLSMVATENADGDRVRKLMMIDAKKAHLNSPCEEEVFVALPEEAGALPGQCGKLNFWLYGFRRAASAWEDFYAKVLENMGFVRGMGCPVIFRHEAKEVVVAVHGDDFVVGGP